MSGHHSASKSMLTRSLFGASVVALSVPAVAASATAQGISVLYSFCNPSQVTSHGSCGDGAAPQGALVTDSGGNIYGTTINGGTGNGGYGGGTVFELTNTKDGWSESVVYNFCSLANCADGEVPRVGLTAASVDGVFYGVTQYGGGTQQAGVVFKVVAGGQETVLHAFCQQSGCADGATPLGRLFYSSGYLYGTTEFGGAYNQGTVFRLNARPPLVEEVIYNFCAESRCIDGANPQAGVVVDSHGNIFGTTGGGGLFGSGSLFELEAHQHHHTWSDLHEFCSSQSQDSPCKDGSTPVADLFMDSSGKLHGTTAAGGNGDPGYGTVFSGSDSTELVVTHRFCNTTGNCNDGLYPLSGVTSNGASIFGTTESSLGGGEAGALYEIKTDGKESVLYYFGSNDKGTGPIGGVLYGAAGLLYGTTSGGGANNAGGEVWQFVTQEGTRPPRH